MINYRRNCAQNIFNSRMKNLQTRHFQFLQFIVQYSVPVQVLPYIRKLSNNLQICRLCTLQYMSSCIRALHNKISYTFYFAVFTIHIQTLYLRKFIFQHPVPVQANVALYNRTVQQFPNLSSLHSVVYIILYKGTAQLYIIR